MLTITREYKSNCTIGEAVYDDFKCCTLELAWLRNAVNISCIPSGIYACKKIVSPSLGECFEIQDVPNRTLIRGHKANHTRQLLGCIAFGEDNVDFDNDGITDVTNSKNTFEALMEVLPDTFMMEVV